MGEPKFTPGPWSVRPEPADSIRYFRLIGSNIGPDGEDLTGPSKNGGIWVAESKGPDCAANAHLIAAAPELYEMAALLKSCVEYDIRRSEADGDDEGAAMKRLTLARVDAVLAKARGEQP